MYKIKSATLEDLCKHFYSVSKSFTPPLNSYVDLNQYAEKLTTNSITFEYWHLNELVGLIACYFNDNNNYRGFISNVSIYPFYKGKGIMKQILHMVIEYGRDNHYKIIELEVTETNKAAINLYKSVGFIIRPKKDNYSPNIFMRRNITTEQ